MPELNLSLTTIPGLILAIRDGNEPHMLMETLGEDPLYTYSLWETLESSLGELVVVLAAGDDQIEAGIRGWFPGTRVGFAYTEGAAPDPHSTSPSLIASSIRAGLAGLPRDPAPEAVMVLGANMPFVKPETIDTLISIHRGAPEPRIVLPQWARGFQPALFPIELLTEFLAHLDGGAEADGGTPGPETMDPMAERVQRVSVGQPDQSLRVTTPRELESAQKALANLED